MIKFAKQFLSKTHPIVTFLQLVLTAISTAALYYGGLPAQWQTLIPDQVISYLAKGGLIITFLLQFSTHKKQTK